jgi:hypothetical protein
MGPSDEGDFWISSEHDGSSRVAAVADEGESVWLYFTEPGGAEIAASGWLFNRVPAPTAEDVEARVAEYQERGTPPPATREVVDDEAVLDGPLDGTRVTFEWSGDGESVAVSVDGELAGFIGSGEERGYSAHLRMDCAWGQPLDMTRYIETFDGGAP